MTAKVEAVGSADDTLATDRDVPAGKYTVCSDLTERNEKTPAGGTCTEAAGTRSGDPVAACDTAGMDAPRGRKE
jgi:hypothetical protein